MRDDQADYDYDNWTTMQRRGRQRVDKASKDPNARARLQAEILPPSPMLLRPRHDEVQPALSCFPAYCSPAATPTCLSADKVHGFSFLSSFPAEVRNAIYEYAIDYPTCRQLCDAYYNQIDASRARKLNSVPNRFTLGLSTPTVLLLCKQITRETLSVLRLRPFVIDRIPPWIMGSPRPLPLTYLISRATLQNVRFMEIRLSLGEGERYSSGRVWFQVLENVLRAMCGRNSLIRMNVMMKVSNIDNETLWDFELRNYIEIVNMIDKFAFHYGSKPDLVQYEHWVIDRNYAYKCGFRNPLIRKHPDPNIWQGSVLEWI
ncbi:hypothetical protein F5B22DRAFT_252098 [Xylaria bambusicola]|uniref:uncharacterized protein n=1 Tax=Xylaria bambusicola TaxID=326684 RepID=UPI0020088FF6|nr:uncharacterized protein F5B22DRAFT_252098 [Xylaria bambusicola]KAI0525756.1 hypothetical protein F5B22DRAFT_252098 [Xylaria bambusicola]